MAGCYESYSTNYVTWVDASNCSWIADVKDYNGWDAPNNQRY